MHFGAFDCADLAEAFLPLAAVAAVLPEAILPAAGAPSNKACRIKEFEFEGALSATFEQTLTDGSRYDQMHNDFGAARPRK